MNNALVLPTSCSILTTEECDLRCTYCFEHHKNNWMDDNTAKKAVDWLFQNANITRVKSVDMTMFGGEPLLNWKVMRTIFEQGCKRSEEMGIQFTCAIITNCTIMNDELFELLKLYRDKVSLTVQLSIDGIPEIQNMYRVTKDGGPSWQMVEKVVPYFKEIFKECPERLYIHGCLNKKSLPYAYESYKFFRDELGIPRVWFLPVAEEAWDIEDAKIYKEQLEKIYIDIIDIAKKENDVNRLHDYTPLDRLINGCQQSPKTCGAGINYVSINTAGDIYPCHQFYFNDNNDKETIIGNLDIGIDELSRKIFMDYDARYEMVGCKDCDHSGCYRCIAANYVNNGYMLYQTRDFYCEMMKMDKIYQVKMKEVAEKMLTNKNINKEKECQGECQTCNQHTSSIANGCDIVSSTPQQQSQELNIPDIIATFSDAMGIIINKLKDIEDIVSNNAGQQKEE